MGTIYLVQSQNFSQLKNIYFNTFCNTQIEKYCNSAILIIEAANLKVDPRADVKDEDT